MHGKMKKSGLGKCKIKTLKFFWSSILYTLCDGSKLFFLKLTLCVTVVQFYECTNIPSCRRDESKTSFPLQE